MLALSVPRTGISHEPASTGSYRGYAYRVSRHRSIIVTWPRGTSGYSSELGIRYNPIPTAHGTRTEVALYRRFGAELPTDVFEWLAGEICGPLQVECDELDRKRAVVL